MSIYGFTDNYCFSFWISFQPLLDIAIYIQKLTGAIGIQGPALMLGYMAVSGLLLTR